MSLFLANLSVRNLLLFIGLIVCLVNSAASRCSCPSRNEIELNEDHDRAVILSPNFPRPYCSKLNCEWRIEAPSNSSLVRFASKKIDLRPRRDYIYFYDSGDVDEPSHNCTGRIRNCEFVSSGPLLIVQFSVGRGTNDKYGFQGTLTLFDNEDDIQSLSDNDDEADQIKHSKSSAWSLFVWIILTCVIVLIIAALTYWFCKRQRAGEENRSPLLEKSSKREDSVHLSLNSPDELNE